MIPFIGPLIGAVSSFLKGRQDIQKEKITAKAKLQLGQQLSDAEWEAMGVQSGDGSLKDEYITVIITLPIPYVFVGNTFYAFTGDSRILDANRAALEQLGQLMDTPYGQLVFAVSLAAVGLKSIKNMWK
jgi:hypothetical protein